MKFIAKMRILRFKYRLIDDAFIAASGINPSNDARRINPVDSHETGVMGIKHLGKIKKTRSAEIRRNPLN
ncbi:MAG: hypothetical protein WB792_00745, partial [Desulfobacterales bacterium]